jgi:PAS domain S-box-containing protein
VLADGLIFAACACAFLLVVTGRTARIEVLVSERTNALEMEITEHKRAEEALIESETKLQAIFNTVGTGFFIIDRDTQNIIEANQTAVEMTGLPKERIVGQNCHLLVCPAEVGKCPVKDLGQKLDHSERKLIHTGGQSKDILKTVYPVTINGRDCYVESFIDITDRKRAEAEKEKLEAQLFHSQKMESIGRLAGGVAHDFNNMLGVIIGRAELALNKGVPTDELRHNLQEILKAGLRSAELTRQLLAFARKQIAVPKILDLNDTISSMLKMLRRLIGEDIELLWAPELDLWKVKMDPSQVDQILANLAVNSRDAISGVGAITMRTENVAIDDSIRAETPEFIPGEYVLLTVSDTGAGMSKEVCENIFEPFFTTKEVGKGTGLGLSTVYGIVKQNDGFVYVASEPGKGTTFKIYLPRLEVQTAQAPSEDAAGKHPTGTETILLVEDDEAILNLSRVILENLGYTVIAASAPEQAINLVEDHPGDIHLLITDVVMPGMNGRELAERLCAIRPNLKRLYMSGYTADLIAHRGILDAGVNFIQKPFGSDELAARVREVLDQLE